MTTNTSIGNEDEKMQGTPARPDLTREEIESGNDQSTSADQGNRSGRTSHGSDDDAIELGK